MNVLVYSGPEVLEPALKYTLSVFKRLLVPNYIVQTVSPESLRSPSWSAACSLLVLPSAHEITSNGVPASVQNYVENGGSLLGISMGASTARSLTNLTLPSFTSALDGRRKIRFFDKESGQSVHLKSLLEGRELTGERVGVRIGETFVHLHQIGSAEFAGLDKLRGFEVIARYASQDRSNSASSDGATAALKCMIGTGTIVVWAPALDYSVAPNLPQTDHEQTERVPLLRNILRSCGLQLPSVDSPVITHPLPQFLICPSSKPDISSSIIRAIFGSSTLSHTPTFQDKDDTFGFHAFEDGLPILEASRSDVTVQANDPASWQPKHVIVSQNGELPSLTHTPYFSAENYFSDLAAARSQNGCSLSPEPWGIGEALLYGETVTSTQTMLDRNLRFLSLLPTPLVSLASFQLTGRGRGGNTWLSPAGCLQFSLRLRAALPQPKLTFIQYLFSLAVVEACRSDNVLGSRWGNQTRLKWPNDIYAVINNDGTEERKKIGGVLVFTISQGGQYDIVIGCGLNVLNAPPITSLSQLVPPGTDTDLTMERTGAAILSKFESMWTQYLAGNGSFAPFIDLYLQRWLHSDQLVTLTTTNPPTTARITGITLDYGLLRTIPERTGGTWRDWQNTTRTGFIDLMPDANSFDIMTGLIKPKTT